MAFDSEIAALRKAVAQRLQAAPEFDGIRILELKPGDIANEIERSLAKIGIAIIVAVTSFEVQSSQSARLVLDPVRIQVEVQEDLITNRTGREALYLVERVLARLKLATIQLQPNERAIIQPAKPGVVYLSAMRGDERKDSYLHGWEIFFETRMSLQPAA